MSHKINTPIPVQKFELLRDALGAILKIELDHQGTTETALSGITIAASALPIDVQELPIINISIGNADFEDKDPGKVGAVYVFNVDVYAASIEREQQGIAHRNRIAGAVRYILDHPSYDTFGFAPPFVRTSKVSGIQFSDEKATPETNNITAARISVSISVCEENVLDDAVPLNEFTSIVKLELTEKGYRYEYINS